MSTLRLALLEIRILGSLIEKELATPEYYPLSLNALRNACNQKSNRLPVMNLDEQSVLEAVQSLKEQRIVYQSDAGRVPKFWQAFTKEHDLDNRDAALLSVLLLRGPQTPGELRSRSTSLYLFESLEEVTSALEHLQALELVAQVPRQPGQKEQRYVHLLAAESSPVEPKQTQELQGEDTSAQVEERLSALEEQVALLQEELAQVHRLIRSFQQGLD